CVRERGRGFTYGKPVEGLDSW
nr:immunoglobulin heavy chain junction region [Macaca mulatta]